MMIWWKCFWIVKCTHALEISTLLLAASILCVFTVEVIFIVMAVDVTGALFLANCLNVFYWEQGVYFFAYLTKRYLSNLSNLEAGWTDWVDLGSGQRQYQNSEWHLQLLILKSRCQRCEEASFKKFCNSYCSHRGGDVYSVFLVNTSTWEVIDEGVANRWRTHPLAGCA